MSWILLATAGQLFNALVAILDKYIVSDENLLPRPFVYAFYTCIFTSAWVLVYFLGFIPGLPELGFPTFSNINTSPTLEVVALSFLAAYTFFIALVSMYDALRRADASNVMPVIGSISALATFGFSYLLLDIKLSDNFTIGVTILAVGTLLVAQTLPRLNTVIQVVHSGLFFAMHYITMKGLFNLVGFDAGFFWSRIGFVLFTLSLLLVPVYFEKVKKTTKAVTKKTGFIISANKILAGIAAFVLLKATHLGDPAVVQALGGLQYVFILFLSVFLAKWLPKTATGHELKPKVTFQRLLYVVVILVGFVVLFT